MTLYWIIFYWIFFNSITYIFYSPAGLVWLYYYFSCPLIFSLVQGSFESLQREYLCDTSPKCSTRLDHRRIFHFQIIYLKQFSWVLLNLYSLVNCLDNVSFQTDSVKLSHFWMHGMQTVLFKSLHGHSMFMSCVVMTWCFDTVVMEGDFESKIKCITEQVFFKELSAFGSMDLLLNSHRDSIHCSEGSPWKHDPASCFTVLCW